MEKRFDKEKIMPRKSGGSIRITGIGTSRERWHLTGSAAQAFFDGMTKKPEPESTQPEEIIEDYKNFIPRENPHA
jgi:hypothetical protein